MSATVLMTNVKAQIVRLQAELKDLEDMKEELDNKEYLVAKETAIKQLEEFTTSYGNLQSSIMTSKSEVPLSAGAVALSRENERAGLRSRIACFASDLKLGKISQTSFYESTLELLQNLSKIDELRIEEKQLLEVCAKRGETGVLISGEVAEAALLHGLRKNL